MRRSFPLVAFVFAFVATAGCHDATAPGVEPPAYDPTQLSGGLLYRWPTGTTIAVYVDPTAVAAGVDLAGATASGMQAWKAALGGSQFTFRTATSPADADVIVHVSGAPRLVGLASCATPPDVAGGVTFLCPARDSALTLPLLAEPGTGRVKIDIAINPAATNATYSLLALVTHELGHAVGIGGHSTDSRDVMYAQPSATVPTQRDIVTLRWVVRQPIVLRL
jgi:predicted Zn-dependent protease